MNLANRLTLLRVALIPVFLLVLYVVRGNSGHYIACAIFVFASITDFVDGYIARSRNMVTDFGKFMDPLADKLLVSAALIYFVEAGRLSAVVVIVIISREFIISGFRLMAALKNEVIAASMWGKVKTFTTMVMIIVMLLEINYPLFIWLETILIFCATLFTVISAIDYIGKNINVFHE